MNERPEPLSGIGMVVLGSALIVLMLLGAMSPARADSDVGRSAADFLQIEVGARAVGMGGAFTSLADDAYGGYWNPAGLTSASSQQVGASHQSGIFTVENESLSYVHPLGNGSTFGLNSRLLHVEDDERLTPDPEDDGTDFTNWGGSLGLQYAFETSPNLSVGIGGNVIRQRLGGSRGTDATTIALDAGFLYQVPGSNTRIGGAAQNYGPDLEFHQDSEPLPRTLRLGASHRFVFKSEEEEEPDEPQWGQRDDPQIFNLDTELIVAFDVSHLESEGLTRYHAGTELRAGILALRSGWQVTGSGDNENRDGLTVGLGVRLGRFQLDYSWSDRDVFDNGNYFSAIYQF